MKNEITMLLIALSLMVGSTTLVYATEYGVSVFTYNDGYGPEIEECVFTANIEKSWVLFTERPWVSGFVTDCDSQRWEYSDNQYDYQLKDTIQVRILDIDGNLVDDHIADKDNIPKGDEIVYSKYSFRDYVYRGGHIAAHLDAADEGSNYLQENQYFFEMPQINSRDFEHREVYQIELTYGDHVQTLWFVSLDPEIPYWLTKDQQDTTDPCYDFENKLVTMNNTLTSIQKQIERYEGLGQIEKMDAAISVMEQGKTQIESLTKCQL